jgi:hypothetical protein
MAILGLDVNLYGPSVSSSKTNSLEREGEYPASKTKTASVAFGGMPK